MANIGEALKVIGKQIKEFEAAVYQFETVVYPRYEADKTILQKLKDDFIRMQTLQEKIDKGEDVTQQDAYDVIPVPFR